MSFKNNKKYTEKFQQLKNCIQQIVQRLQIYSWWTSYHTKNNPYKQWPDSYFNDLINVYFTHQ